MCVKNLQLSNIICKILKVQKTGRFTITEMLNSFHKTIVTQISTLLKIVSNLCNLQLAVYYTGHTGRRHRWQQENEQYFFVSPTYLRYFANERFSGTLREAFRKSQSGANMRERVLCAIPEGKTNKEGRTGRPSHEE